ncbi:MAG: D-alanyl-D-alanine carboxypeptidase family protein, partial [Oscillatoriales cyanobacterium SM2_2_1]|nr:D-alanyl-D-alanine carboxypeptidase family protein [Oscillatoriales cyanobacterium SM2_2_1]
MPFSSPWRSPVCPRSPPVASSGAAPTDPVTIVEPTLPPSNDPQRVDQLFGHFRYDQAAVAELRTVARAADGYEFKLRASAAQSYLDMAAAAQQEGIELTVISAFRSTEEQEKLFFDISRQRNQSLQQRAQTSAPPGYSEHHTGNAIDLGDAAVPSANLSPTFEQTRAFRWLEQNAKRYSFELSFPRNNCQGVLYEPWHWRFVGDPESLKMFYQNRPQPSICPPNHDPTAIAIFSITCLALLSPWVSPLLPATSGDRLLGFLPSIAL